MAEKRKANTTNLLGEAVRKQKKKNELQKRRNEEATRLALEAKRIRDKREREERDMAEAQRNLNTRGSMIQVMRLRALQEREREQRRVEAMYQRMLGQVMRRATFTPTDFKQLGKIAKARSDNKIVEVERLIKEWTAMVKKRACRLKKKNMQNIATGLNIDTSNRKKKRAQICQEIKNKI
jgi:hypothetical protein